MKAIKYKLQGDTTDSWEISEYDEKMELTDRYMVYEDPEKIKLALTDDEITAVFNRAKELKLIQ